MIAGVAAVPKSSNLESRTGLSVAVLPLELDGDRTVGIADAGWRGMKVKTALII